MPHVRPQKPRVHCRFLACIFSFENYTKVLHFATISVSNFEKVNILAYPKKIFYFRLIGPQPLGPMRQHLGPIRPAQKGSNA